MPQPECTDLCSRLRNLRQCGGKLPSHGDIKEQLQLSQREEEEGWSLGTWAQVGQRTTCAFCRLVTCTIIQSRSASEGDIPDDQSIRMLLIPDAPAFRVASPLLMGVKMVFAAEGRDQVSSTEAARRVVSPRIDPDMMKKWLKTCDNEHDTCSDTDQPALTSSVPPARANFIFDEGAISNFRLLDLDRRCITRASLDSRYLALSYVWGQVPMFRLQEHNLGQLSTPGVMDDLLPQLPQTIIDAMKLTRDLGERFLWVDALCLAQDSEHDMSLGIELMNTVYRGSYATIVAADGRDAGAGLVGVGCDRSTEELMSTARLGELTLTAVQSIDRHLSRAVYSQRGWTLQEFVLPRRTLIFIDKMVFFRCKAANWAEETWADMDPWHWDSDDNNVVRVPQPSDGRLASLWAYQKILEEYSCRKLRKDGDALRAIAGVTRPLFAGMRTKGLEGLPYYYLHHFLLFISAAGDLRRRREFASFSWSGWEGKVKWPRENFLSYRSGSSSFDISHIFTNIKQNHLLPFEKLSRRGSLESLSKSNYDPQDAALTRFLRGMPSVFDGQAVEQSCSYSPIPRFNSSSGSHMDEPAWDLGSEEDGGIDRWDLGSNFNMKALDAANSRSEYDRLAAKLTKPREMMGLMNWQAMRRFKQRRYGEIAKQAGSGGNLPGTASSHFRRPRLSNEEEAYRIENDRRAILGRSSLEMAAKREPVPDFLAVPKFPPYSVLQFQSISLHLVLGSTSQSRQQQVNARNAASSAHDRIPGIPLHIPNNNNGAIAGSLHPDNIDALGGEGSDVELIVIAKCQTPTVASAIPKGSEDGPMDLLWVMAVQITDGVAERRGIGQIYCSVLEGVRDPKPQLKWILLG